MNEKQRKNVKHVFNASILMQIAMEQLECVTSESPFVRENKQRLNNTIHWLNTQNEAFTNEMEAHESSLFSDITDEIRKVLNGFSLKLE